MSSKDQNNIVVWLLGAITVLLAVIAIGVFVAGGADQAQPVAVEGNLGAIGTNPVENYIPIIKFNEGYYSALPITTTGALTAGATTLSGTLTGTIGTFSGDLTVGGGDLTVTTSNTATSTVEVGCLQTYATSTATPIRWSMDLISTSTASDQYGGTVDGLVTWGYGECPF